MKFVDQIRRPKFGRGRGGSAEVGTMSQLWDLFFDGFPKAPLQYGLPETRPKGSARTMLVTISAEYSFGNTMCIEHVRTCFHTKVLRSTNLCFSN